MRIIISVLIAPLLFLTLCAAPKKSLTQKSDRENDGLKGSVKSVVYQSVRLKEIEGKLVEQEGNSYSVTDYNAEGDKLQVEIYRGGKLASRDTYFYLDGARVAKSEDFLPVGDGVGGGPGPGPGTPDPRFTAKFSYTYNNQGYWGEETRANNRGNNTLLTTRLYDDRGNLQEERKATFNGGKTPQTINTRIFTNGPQGVASKEDMSGIQISEFSDYEFDNQGNWLKRKVKITNIYNPQKPQVNFSLTSRKITYF